MSDRLTALLRAKLDDPDPVVRMHARNRLAALESDPPSEYPSIAAQAVGLAGSLATWARAGFPITPAAERARRRGICTACPEFDSRARRCRKCGCFGELKPWLGTAACPLGKWGGGA